VVTLAHAEDLPAHGQAVTARFPTGAPARETAADASESALSESALSEPALSEPALSESPVPEAAPLVETTAYDDPAPQETA
jgi:hypothetical protein